MEESSGIKRGSNLRQGHASLTLILTIVVFVRNFAFFVRFEECHLGDALAHAADPMFGFNAHMIVRGEGQGVRKVTSIAPHPAHSSLGILNHNAGEFDRMILRQIRNFHRDTACDLLINF